MLRATAASSTHSEAFARYCQRRSAMPIAATMTASAVAFEKVRSFRHIRATPRRLHAGVERFMGLGVDRWSGHAAGCGHAFDERIARKQSRAAAGGGRHLAPERHVFCEKPCILLQLIDRVPDEAAAAVLHDFRLAAFVDHDRNAP